MTSPVDIMNPRALESGELVEPFVVTDTFCTELAAVERLGPCVRLTFAAQKRCPLSGKPERQIVAQIVISAEALMSVTAKIAQARTFPDEGRAAIPLHLN